MPSACHASASTCGGRASLTHSTCARACTCGGRASLPHLVALALIQNLLFRMWWWLFPTGASLQNATQDNSMQEQPRACDTQARRVASEERRRVASEERRRVASEEKSVFGDLVHAPTLDEVFVCVSLSKLGAHLVGHDGSSRSTAPLPYAQVCGAVKLVGCGVCGHVSWCRACSVWCCRARSV